MEACAPRAQEPASAANVRPAARRIAPAVVAMACASPVRRMMPVARMGLRAAAVSAISSANALSACTWMAATLAPALRGAAEPTWRLACARKPAPLSAGHRAGRVSPAGRVKPVSPGFAARPTEGTTDSPSALARALVVVTRAQTAGRVPRARRAAALGVCAARARRAIRFLMPEGVAGEASD